MEFNLIVVTVVCVFIYILLMMVVVNGRCTTYKCRDDFSEVDSYTRDATTKDVWVGLCWPILFIWLILRTIVSTINQTVVILGLLVGFKYKSTLLYNKIDKWGI